MINSCICPQNRQNLTFQCSTVGSGNTLWRGSAFSCSQNGDEILLLHSQFIGDRDDAEQCGNITARGLRVEDGVYVSQLTIPFSSYVIGHTVECVHDDSVEPVVIGNSTISFTTGKNRMDIHRLILICKSLSCDIQIHSHHPEAYV